MRSLITDGVEHVLVLLIAGPEELVSAIYDCGGVVNLFLLNDALCGGQEPLCNQM